MPGRNGTGPIGMGAKTGRGMGLCRTGVTPNRIPVGYGLGFGYGCRRGWGRYAVDDTAVVTPEEEKAILENHKAVLEARLKSVKKMLDDFNRSQDQ